MFFNHLYAGEASLAGADVASAKDKVLDLVRAGVPSMIVLSSTGTNRSGSFVRWSGYDVLRSVVRKRGSVSGFLHMLSFLR